ncbi:MAG: MFS transporter [bacterium]|nr:MFS transporter [bacterium]
MRRHFLTLPRNIYLLSISQVLGMSGTTLVALLGGLIGAEIAPTPTLATLPATTMIVGVAATTIPAALIMKKIGRKNGFFFSAILASLAALLMAFAVSHHNFFLFCFGTFLLGTNGAFVQQYRFAATESVGKDMASKAVGFLLFAGILAGFIGPEIAKRTKDMFALPEYTGPFIILAVLLGISALLLTFLKDTQLHEEVIHPKERSLRSIIVQPHFYIAVLAGATGFGVMTFIMTATPIHLHTMSHYSLDATVFVIQSHIIAMFLPSLFTGFLIQKFGVFRILLSGVASFCLTVLLGVNAHGIVPYWVALVLLGIGWNFLYISATVLLAQSHSHLERFKAQGLNDFIVVGSQMLASFFAGTVLFSGGWINLNLLTLPLIFISFIVFFLNRKKLVRA